MADKRVGPLGMFFALGVVGAVAVFLVVAYSLLFAIPVVWLWRWIVAPVFGLPDLTWPGAGGLVALVMLPALALSCFRDTSQCLTQACRQQATKGDAQNPPTAE